MRWRLKTNPKDGDTRIVNKFLLIPKCINGEYRWLEKVKYSQKFRDMSYCFDGEDWWQDICWIDN